MAWFRKKDRVIDLSARYKREQEKAAEIETGSPETGVESPSQSAFGFLGNLASGGSSSESTSSEISSPESDTGYVDVSGGSDERKRKLAKRLLDITNKLEELSNQIYHLQQKVEVLERKMGVGNY